MEGHSAETQTLKTTQIMKERTGDEITEALKGAATDLENMFEENKEKLKTDLKHLFKQNESIFQIVIQWARNGGVGAFPTFEWGQVQRVLRVIGKVDPRTENIMNTIQEKKPKK